MCLSQGPQRSEAGDVFLNKFINSTILSLTKECIPNKSIRVRTSDQPWITTLLKRQVRKRKRLYRKAKQTNLERHWIKFRQLRNETNTMIRNSKQQFYDNIAEKLKSKSLSSKDWWSTLKTFISPSLNSAIPPIESEGKHRRYTALFLSLQILPGASQHSFECLYYLPESFHKSPPLWKFNTIT